LATPLLPVVGTIVGACAGAFLAATGYELFFRRKRADAAFVTGFGAALGKMGGIAAKLAIGCLMLLIAALTYLKPV